MPDASSPAICSMWMPHPVPTLTFNTVSVFDVKIWKVSDGHASCGNQGIPWRITAEVQQGLGCHCDVTLQSLLTGSTTRTLLPLVSTSYKVKLCDWPSGEAGRKYGDIQPQTRPCSRS